MRGSRRRPRRKAPGGGQRIERAAKLLRDGKPRKAAKQLGPVLKSDKPYLRANARYLAGKALRDLGKSKRALRIWAQIGKPTAKRLATAHAYYRGRLAIIRTLREQDRLRSAISVAKSVLEDPPVDAHQARAALVLSRLARSHGARKRARRFCRKGLELLKKIEARDAWPELTEKRKKLRRELRRRLDRLKPEEKGKKGASDGNGKGLLPKRIEQAKKRAKAGHFGQAVRLLEQSVSRAKDHPRRAEARYRIGLFRLRAGETERAFRHWKRWIAEKPSGPWRARAQLEMLDHRLWGQLDLDAAEKRAERLGRAVVQAVPAPSDSKSATAPATRPAATQPSELPKKARRRLPGAWRLAWRSLLQRRARLAFAAEQPKRARKLFEASWQARPPSKRPDDWPADPQWIPRRHRKRVRKALETDRFTVRSRPLPEARGTRPRVVTALRLAELAYAVARFDQSLRWLAAVAAPEASGQGELGLRPTPAQRAYAMARAGQAEVRRFKPKRALKWYAKLREFGGGGDWRAIARLRGEGAYGPGDHRP